MKKAIKFFMSGLHGWSSPCNDGSTSEFDKNTGLEVLQVNSIQSFVQALDYLNLSCMRKKKLSIFAGGIRLR